jgi:cyclopropane-fatty-acyl-phospholipid synthase
MFRAPRGRTHLFQIVFGKGNVSFASYPMTRDFLYERQLAYQEKRSADRAA